MIVQKSTDKEVPIFVSENWSTQQGSMASEVSVYPNTYPSLMSLVDKAN